IDLAFYQTMRERFHVASDFAQAYVIAHEVGHHVQHITGIMDKVNQARRSGTDKQANAISVRIELQADCFAGVWVYDADRARGILEQGDVESALKAASAVGDDALRRQAQGYVVPDSFTHGTSEQRVRWFKQGIESGDLNTCNTFAARTLKYSWAVKKAPMGAFFSGFEKSEAVLGRRERSFLHFANVGAYSTFNAALTFHEILHKTCLLTRKDIDEVMHDQYLT